MKIVNLLSGKEHFYLMHLSQGSNRGRRKMWNFAREHTLIGLDRADINEDWTTNRERLVARLQSVNAYQWIKQFDMLCEDINTESMANGDIVVVMAGKESVLGIGEVIGPHEFNLSYKLQEQFFDHIRPIKWIIEYDYERRKRIRRAEFQNTLRKVEKTRRKDRKLWSLFSELDFEPMPQPIPSLTTKQKTSDTEALEELADIQTKLTKETSQVSRYKRSRELVQKLKELYGYRCQICSPTTLAIPQILMANGRNYVEVHHIRGFNEITKITGVNQDNGEYVIDNCKNVITVCVYHHKLLHKHKDKFSYDPKQKCFISEDKTSKIPLALNKHL